MASLIAKDLFRRLDKISIDNALQFEEVREFFQVGFEETIDERQYRKLLKTKYSHDGDERLDQRGFLELVRDKVCENEKLAWRAFRNWGYDEDLYPV